MNMYVMTLFPEMIISTLGTSIIGRAIEKGVITLNTINIRDYSNNKHRKVDDYPYGGGAGMVMTPEPIYNTYQHLLESRVSKSTKVIYLTPQGQVFNQKMANEYSKEEDLIFLCGHYEGIDQRILDMIVTDYVSIGDYVLTGGELAAMVMIDAISRLVPNVLKNEISAQEESFQNNLLEYPQYTRPANFMNKEVPEVLLSGHHKKIEKWQKEQSIKKTYKYRPDLLKRAKLTNDEKKYLINLEKSDDL